MENVILVIFLFITILFGFQYYLIQRSKRIVGQNISLERLRPQLKRELENKKVLVYFYSENCSACKTQAPVIENLKKEKFNVITIDVSKDLETARIFGIMGTPSIAILDNNLVKEFFVGYQDENKIKKYLVKSQEEE